MIAQALKKKFAHRQTHSPDLDQENRYSPMSPQTQKSWSPSTPVSIYEQYQQQIYLIHMCQTGVSYHEYKLIFLISLSVHND